SEARTAELGARFEAWLLAQGTLTADQSRWLGLLGNQIRANADTWTEVTAGHFAFAPFSLTGGLGHVLRLFGGEAALERRLSSLNAAVFSDTAAISDTGAHREYRGDVTLP